MLILKFVNSIWPIQWLNLLNTMDGRYASIRICIQNQLLQSMSGSWYTVDNVVSVPLFSLNRLEINVIEFLEVVHTWSPSWLWKSCQFLVVFTLFRRTLADWVGLWKTVFFQDELIFCLIQTVLVVDHRASTAGHLLECRAVVIRKFFADSGPFPRPNHILGVEQSSDTMRDKCRVVKVDFSNEFSRTAARNCVHSIKLFSW